jgi:hypothetical protein
MLLNLTYCFSGLNVSQLLISEAILWHVCSVSVDLIPNAKGAVGIWSYCKIWIVILLWSINSGTGPTISSKKFCLLATITSEVVPFHAYPPFPALRHCLNATWKVCTLRVFSISCVLPWSLQMCRWWPFSFIFNWGNRKISGACREWGGGMTVML